MRKEFLYAITIGGILGLIVAFGFWRINAMLSPKGSSNSQVKDENKNGSSVITIAKPFEGDVIIANPLSLTGITKVGSEVVIIGVAKDYLVIPDNKGEFISEIDLTGGINKLTAVSIDAKGQSDKTELTVIFSSEFAKITPPVKETPVETNTSSDSVRQKVQEQVQEAVSSPKAYLGTVTDIAESSIQLKSPAGEINQISVGSETTVIKDGKTTKEVKLTDIAIGDFIVAMGFRNGNKVLDVRRILITSTPSSSNLEVVKGRIIKNASGQITFSRARDGATMNLSPDKDSVAYLKEKELTKVKYSSLKEERLFIATGVSSGSKFTPRTLFAITEP